jgi:hypothetical protein
MLTVERHGGGSHFVRPDRVYRTGVLQSTMGYDPTADAQSVGASFTQYPMDLSVPTSGVNGLGYLSMEPTYPLNGLGAGPIAKLRMKFAAWNARRKARSMAGFGKAMNAMAAAQTGRFMPGGAYAQVGQEYSPQFIAKEQMIANLTHGQGGLPQNWARAQAATSRHIWDNRWWNG